MPGNKNSGRKRKSIESTSSVSDVHSETLTVKKPGRPRKVFIAPDVLTRKSNELVPEEEEATKRKLPAKRTAFARVATHVTELSSRNSALKKHFVPLPQLIAPYSSVRHIRYREGPEK